MKSEIMGIAFDNVTLDEAVDWAMARKGKRRSEYVCTPNPEIVWASRENHALYWAIEGADMILADGVGGGWASHVWKRPLPERVSGMDFLEALLERWEGRVFLLGGRPGVAAQAGAVIAERFPAVTVCGCHDGYFDDDEAVTARIEEAAPDMVLVCLGSPKQELWMGSHRDKIHVDLMIGLGGCLDVLAGQVPRAPERWRKLGLEWLYRLIREPQRIKRQLCLPLFVWTVLAERPKKAGLE